MIRKRMTALLGLPALAAAAVLTAPTAAAADGAIHGCPHGFDCGYLTVAAYNASSPAFAADSAALAPTTDPHVDHVPAAHYAVDVNNESTSFASEGTLIGGLGQRVCTYLRIGDEQAPGVTTMESIEPVNVVVIGSTQFKADHPCG